MLLSYIWEGQSQRPYLLVTQEAYSNGRTSLTSGEAKGGGGRYLNVMVMAGDVRNV